MYSTAPRRQCCPKKRNPFTSYVPPVYRRSGDLILSPFFARFCPPRLPGAIYRCRLAAVGRCRHQLTCPVSHPGHCHCGYKLWTGDTRCTPCCVTSRRLAVAYSGVPCRCAEPQVPATPSHSHRQVALLRRHRSPPSADVCLGDPASHERPCCSPLASLPANEPPVLSHAVHARRARIHSTDPGRTCPRSGDRL